MPIAVKSFTTADEAKDMPNARMEAVNVLGQSTSFEQRSISS